ncbi:MAG: helix-hairpin-helix domain-containing protein [Armatimonadetes bacterium]|nr:helix-hairpin-helix domain-containing protein [Armatimonadota bacterium]
MFTKFFATTIALLSLTLTTTMTTTGFAQTKTTEKAAPKATPMATKKSDTKKSEKAPKAPKATKAEVGVVSLNKATAKELESLPGVGPAIAERIVAYRTEQGKFSEISELMEVKGIGEKKLAQLRPHLTLE